MTRAYYQNSISAFLKDESTKILGELAHPHHFDLNTDQKEAWIYQITNLKEQLIDFESGQIFFEFSIPRMGKRVDAILFIEGIIFVLEYKVGAKTYERYQIDQAMDYSLDLKNFHETSHNKFIVPILLSTKANPYNDPLVWCQDRVAHPIRSNGTNLKSIIQKTLSNIIPSKSPIHNYGMSDQVQNNIEDDTWSQGGYKPTPTIVEAAQALYQKHSVADISRSDAGAKNLTITSNCINSIIDRSRQNGKKSICFVTGVPGAGKTLAGLNISIQKREENIENHAVFLSGNGPLVSILREALIRDQVHKSKLKKTPVSKDSVKREVSSFIQNIHHFRDDYLETDKLPIEHIVVFDEAQRAWNRSQAEKFMTKKRGQVSFNMSEPEFLISIMDRSNDWRVIICLIGGGQEINTGEAGLVEWVNALQSKFKHWDVYHSGHLEHKNYNWGEDLEGKLSSLNAIKDENLHLGVSIRSYRAEKLSDFVSAIIEGDAQKANSITSALENYPIVLTRDINHARDWLRKKSRGTERLGLVASSGAIRLKPEGIMVKTEIDPVIWFLNGKEDIRSSYYLEDAATEFHVQGLELDWVGVCWDADLRMENVGWSHYNFKGTKWQNVKDIYRRTYLENAYRVLLTRARQGMVIFVPEGDESDSTRPPAYYDGIYNFLKNCGIKDL